MSELHHHRFAVAAFRALERPLVMIWIVSRIDPRKKQRHAADKASTFSDWWNLGVEYVWTVHFMPPSCRRRERGGVSQSPAPGLSRWSRQGAPIRVGSLPLSDIASASLMSAFDT